MACSKAPGTPTRLGRSVFDRLKWARKYIVTDNETNDSETLNTPHLRLETSSSSPRAQHRLGRMAPGVQHALARGSDHEKEGPSVPGDGDL